MFKFLSLFQEVQQMKLYYIYKLVLVQLILSCVAFLIKKDKKYYAFLLAKIIF